MPSDPPRTVPTLASDAFPAETGVEVPERYELGRMLGAGGMGEVLLATDTQIGRDVAIKRMRLSPSQAAVARFIREAKIQGQLDHPAIVPVHELGTDAAGRPYFVMKRLAGKTLGAHLAAGTKTRQQLLRALSDVCLAVERAHTAGIIHRDLKPANIMLGDFGEVYVLDWGLARVLGEPAEASAPLSLRDTDPTMDVATAEVTTEAGSILGTPGYMPPELFDGAVADARADVYALGCILFEILAGEPMQREVRGDAATLDASRAKFDGARASERAPGRDVPPELDELVVEATRPVHAERLASARQLADRIDRYLDGDRDAALRRKLAATHLAAARAALAGGDGERQRAEAMREAGRALALDPTSDAGELIGALMVRPPSTVPREVEQRLGVIEGRASRATAYSTVMAIASYWLFIPLLLWIGVRDMRWVVAFAGLSLLDAGFIWLTTRNVDWISTRRAYGAAVINAVAIAVIARMFSPALIAPGIAAISVWVFGVDVRLRGSVLALIHIAAIAIPWLLEIVGVLSPTMWSIDGNVVFRSPALAVHEPATTIILALYVVVLIGLAGITARRFGHATRASLRRAELQAWHLQQMTPPAAA